MTAAKRWILENENGQRIRSFQVESSQAYLIYRLDTGRVELHADLIDFDEQEIAYQIIQTVQLSQLEKGAVTIKELGRLRLAAIESLDNKSYLLAPEQDEEKLKSVFKKTGLSHIAMVALLIIFSLILNALKKQEVIEPQLVTIIIPQQDQQAIQPVAPAVKKVAPIFSKQARVTNRNVQAPTVKKQIVKKVVQLHRPQAAPVVSQQPERQLERVGALAALGGLKNGARNAQGIDMNSLKNIRAAGTGSGGGGIGRSGPGGISGMMNGKGLIAGSAGNGGKAQSAGGYGTKGVGGGKAGYGKIAIVGGTASLGLPTEDAEVQGGLAMEQIAAVVKKNEGQIRYCYEQGLQSQPGLRGRVAMKFVISGSGRITTLKVAQSSLGSQFVESCIAQKMRTWQFPQPVGNVNVDVFYPFDLTRLTSN